MNAQPDAGPADQRLSEILAAYLEAIDAGWAPDRDAFLDRYPDLAPDLGAFFQNQDRVAHLVQTLPPPCPPTGRGRAAPGGGAPADAPTLPESGVPPRTHFAP